MLNFIFKSKPNYINFGLVADKVEENAAAPAMPPMGGMGGMM